MIFFVFLLQNRLTLTQKQVKKPNSCLRFKLLLSTIKSVTMCLIIDIFMEPANHEQIVYNVPDDQTAIPSCFEDTSYRDKYLQILNTKKNNSLSLYAETSAQYLQIEEKLFLRWKAAYAEAVQTKQKDPLHASIKATFRYQLFVAYFASYASVILHIGTAFLLYLVFRHLALGYYGSNQNLIPIIAIILINISRPFIKKYSQLKLHQIGLAIYKLIAQALTRKSLNCSVLSNKRITTSQMSKLMHVDCQKLLELPYKNAGSIEGILYFGLLAFLVILLAQWAGVISLSILLLLVVFRYSLKNTIKAKQQELNYQTNRRIKTTIEVFSMIKYIKANALESCFFNSLRAIRKTEVEKLREKLFYDVLMIVMSVLLRALALAVTMKLVLAFKGKFDIAIAFCINISFSFINFQNIMKNFAIYQDIKASMREIELFLNTEEMNATYLKIDNKASFAIRISKGDFQWEIQDKTKMQGNLRNRTFSLKNINIQIQKGELIALIGTYGSGKTTLVNSLLGQIKSNGDSQVTINGKLAYCCQNPWIMNQTVKNNILFGEEFNNKRYEQAIKFSCLEDDLLILKEGDSTVIGQKGSTLSGGQRARISLARALYSNADIYILDDILSAVDAHVGSLIFNQTVKNYLKNKTILLITHSLYFLQHTDRIFVLQNGAIQHQGNYRELKTTQILAQVQFTDLKAHKEKEQNPANKNNVMNIDNDFQKDKLAIEQLDEGIVVIGTSESLSIYIERNSGCFFAVVMGIFTILIAFLMNFSKLWLNIWSVSLQQKDNYFIFVLVGISLIQSLFLMLMSMTLYKSKIFELLHNDMVRSLLFAPYTYFQNTPFDKIVNIFSNQLNANDKTFTSEIILAQFQSQLVLSYVFGHIFVYHTAGSFILLFYFILHFSIMIYFYQTYFSLNLMSKQLEQSLITPIKSKYSEVLNGLSTIRAYQKVQFILADGFLKIEHFVKSSTLRWQIEQKLKIIVSFASNSYAFLMLGVIFFMADSIGPLCVFLIFNAFSFQDSIMRFHRSFNELAARLKSFGRCQQMTRIEPQKGYIKYLSEHYIQDADFKHYYYPIEIFSKGEIVFQSYSFKYNPQQEDVLKNINLHIRPAEKIGIVGRTGSGKSSIMLALLRIIESSNGKILIDNIDISTLSLQQLRSNINIILQDHFLFTGSLRQNIDPSHSYNDQEIIVAFNLCGIWNIFEGKQGLETLITEGGNNLSSGEKQLINISRSLLNPKKIVLIDQATASIDLQTDFLIQKVIKRQFTDKTVLTIAHRINTVLDSDRILVLSQGKIVEFDTPKNLLANQNSLFAKLYKESGKNKAQ